MKKTKRRVGRPNRAAATAAALAGKDLSALDPVAVLRQIAADDSAPAAARVSAARALLLYGAAAEQPQDHGGDAVSRAALKLLQGGRK